MRPSLQTLTLGCSKNRVDTEHILSQLEGHYEIIPEDARPGYCDVFLLNTCGFIGDAKEESIAAILEAVGRKQRGETGKVVVFGCLSQRYSTEMPELIPEVDAWFGAIDFDPMLEYLGVIPPNDRLGVLQDVHWTSGGFGYFPTYALGSAIASQLYAKMSSDIDVDKCIRSGSTFEINKWLKERVHKYGDSKYPKEILRIATGEDFNPDYYVEYLIKKYSDLYNAD